MEGRHKPEDGSNPEEKRLLPLPEGRDMEQKRPDSESLGLRQTDLRSPAIDDIDDRTRADSGSTLSPALDLSLTTSLLLRCPYLE